MSQDIDRGALIGDFVRAEADHKRAKEGADRAEKAKNRAERALLALLTIPPKPIPSYSNEARADVTLVVGEEVWRIWSVYRFKKTAVDHEGWSWVNIDRQPLGGRLSAGEVR